MLATIWGLFSFFSWIATMSPVVLMNFAYGLIGITIYIVFAFVWEIIWRFFHKVSSQFDSYADDLGFKYLGLTIILILGVIWTLFSFFTWIPGIAPTALVTFAYGFIGLTILLFFIFIWYLLWAFFHKTSEKL